jgi:hypothetical protein
VTPDLIARLEKGLHASMRPESPSNYLSSHQESVRHLRQRVYYTEERKPIRLDRDYG